MELGDICPWITGQKGRWCWIWPGKWCFPYGQIIPYFMTHPCSCCGGSLAKKIYGPLLFENASISPNAINDFLMAGARRFLT